MLINQVYEKLLEVVLQLLYEHLIEFVMYTPTPQMQNIYDFIQATSALIQTNEPVLHVTDIDTKK